MAAKKTVGSKLEVYRGKASHTSGGLEKDDLIKNKQGKVVSKKKHEVGMTTGKANLDGYLQSKGAPLRRSGRKKVR